MGKRVLLFNLIIIGLLSLLLNFSCSMPQQNIDKENKEEKQSEIDKILSQYDIEKKSLEEISMFFKTEVENNSIAVNNK